MKYIQSFYQYPVTFSSIGKTIPARSAQGEMRNICEVTEKELERLRNCEPMFRELEDKKKLRVLNKIPVSYVPPAVQINNAHEEAEKLRAELEAAKAKLEVLEKKEAELEESKKSDAETEEVKTEEVPAKQNKHSNKGNK